MGWRVLEVAFQRVDSGAAPNDGMHPTASQQVSYRELVRLADECAPGDAWR